MKRKVVNSRVSRHEDGHIQYHVGDLKPYALGHSLGMLGMMILVFYGLFVWFSNYESVFIVARYPIAFSFYDWTILLGLVQSYVMFYVVGWTVARLYNSV